jgi:hypothetical protein
MERRRVFVTVAGGMIDDPVTFDADLLDGTPLIPLSPLSPLKDDVDDNL